MDPLGDPHWQAQPVWVKALTILVGIPAWLVIFYIILSGNLDDRLLNVAFPLFAIVCLLQCFFIARAYWRYDI